MGLRGQGSRPTRRTRRAAFSLIEVLAAVFAAVTCAAIVFATMPVANSSRAKAKFENLAMNLAQKQLEAVRGQGYANLAPDKLASIGLIDSSTPLFKTTYSFTNADLAVLDNPATVLTDGKGSVEIDDIATDLKQVIVTVTWRERSKSRSVQLGTIVANL